MSLAFVRAPRPPSPPPPPTPPPPDAAAGPLWAVRVIDNDHNTYEQVMRVAMAALGVDVDQAYAIAWTVDHRGSCVVAELPREEAEAVAAQIRTIGIEVRVEESAIGAV